MSKNRNICNNNEQVEDQQGQVDHIIQTTYKRSRCFTCYDKMVKEYGRGHAMKHAKQVKTVCPGCNPTASMCMDCFLQKHKCLPKK